MIIECPSCATRYDIDLPPQGRTVRCAKCQTVWRAVPQTSQELDADEPSWAPPSKEREGPRQSLPAQASHDPFSTVDGAGAAERPLLRHTEAHREEERGHDAEPPDAQPNVAQTEEAEDGAEKVRWFTSFRRGRKSGDAQGIEGSADQAQAHLAAETIPFPRANFPVTQRPSQATGDEEEFQSARQALRDVFSGPGRSESAAPGSQAVADPAAAVWTKRWSDEGARDGEDAGRGPRSQADDDPDAALREALRAHFDVPNGTIQDAPLHVHDDVAAKLATQFKPNAEIVREEPRLDRASPRWSEQHRPEDEDAFDHEPPSVEDTLDGKDDDAVFDQRLFREIEETQEKSGDALRPRRGGGLALAAASGLFLCVAGGLIAGFVVFRDIVADAVPGLAPLYRTLGIPVTEQPFAFESVEYKWSLSDNRPVLTVSGSVLNRSQHSIKVPQFFITLKDQDPQLDQQYSGGLKVEGSKIGSNERANFAIELASPNPTLTAVELDLRNVR